MARRWQLRALVLLLYYVFYIFPIACPILILSLPIMFFLNFWKSGSHLSYGKVVINAPISLVRRIQLVYDDKVLARCRQHKSEREYRRLKPVSLPAVRERELSQERIIPQKTCSFLTDMPLEIRQMIYKEVIRSGTFHRHIIEVKRMETIRGRPKRASNQLCGIGCTGSTYHTCKPSHVYDMANVCGVMRDAPEPHYQKISGGCSPLALAKACRQVYLESINLFYG